MKRPRLYLSIFFSNIEKALIRLLLHERILFLLKIFRGVLSVNIFRRELTVSSNDAGHVIGSLLRTFLLFMIS